MSSRFELAADLHRYSPADYHRVIDAGGFDEDARVELLDGLLFDMSPKGRSHENAVAWLGEWLTLAIDRARFQVRVAAPLTLGDSEPEPDLAVVPRASPQPYHPSTAALVIEVASSSLARDLVAKARLYARAGIGEYWVLDLEGRRLVVHRAASGDAWTEVSEPESVTAASIGLPPLDLGALLAAADA